MTTAFQDMAPDGTLAQQELLFRGQLTKVAAPVLAWASLANGQTFVTITPAGAVDSRTIDAALAASTDRPTFCAALAAELNTAGTTAYNWTVNTSSPVDGLIGTAKNYGSAWNSAPTGTSLVGGVGSITTLGKDPATSLIAQGDSIQSVGGLVVGDIAVLTAGVLSGALNDTAAHAEIAGVWDGARLITHGAALVNMTGTITVGALCYLSGTSKLATIATPTAVVYPRLIGKIQAQISATQALVQVNIDVARDKATEWKVAEYTSDTDITSLVIPAKCTIYKRFRLLGTKLGKNGVNGHSLHIKPDGADASTGGSQYWLNMLAQNYYPGYVRATTQNTLNEYYFDFDGEFTVKNNRIIYNWRQIGYQLSPVRQEIIAHSAIPTTGWTIAIVTGDVGFKLIEANIGKFELFACESQ